MDSGRLFKTTCAHTLTAQLAKAVLVDSTARSVLYADHNDILITEYELKSDHSHNLRRQLEVNPLLDGQPIKITYKWFSV